MASFLDIFEERQEERGRGAPADHDYDLLRAMLIFACSGLDATIKHAIREALPAVIDRVDRAEDNFRDFVERRLRAERANVLLSKVLTARDSRAALVDELVRDLTANSLQSKDQILRAASFFDLPSRDLVSDMVLFDSIFHTRNQIAHEMDIDFDQPRRNRTPRRKQRMLDLTHAALSCAAKFLAGVDAKLSPR